MMKKIIIGLFLLVGFSGWGQEEVLEEIKSSISTRHRVITDSVTQYDAADRVYGNLQALVPTGKLYNRLMLEDTLESVVWNLNDITTNEDEGGGATADHAYGLLYEMRLMSFDTASVPSRLEVFNSVSMYVGENEFEEEEYYYPIGIFDYEYNSLDEQLNEQKGNVLLKDSSYSPHSTRLIIEKRKASRIAPLYDLHDSPRMAIVFKEEYFFSNYRKTDDIKSIMVTYNKKKYRLNFDELFYFIPDESSTQTFPIIITYYDNTTLSNHITIHTPEIENEYKEKGLFSFERCALEDKLSGSRGEKLKWCLIEGCGNNSTRPRISKPYILITGYRPPIVGQSFRKTWKYYNTEHHELLNHLRNNGYDVFIVKFNMAAKPNKLGILEASLLLEEFILWVNEQKGGQPSGQENIIQGSSMGASVARLTLLRMEKKHFEDNSYPNHHSRLNIAYDGNFYGANLPLSYQAQIYSAMYYPRPGVGSFVTTFLYASMQQKATKELLTYHIQYLFNNVFAYPSESITYTPSHHSRRQGLLDELNLVNNNYVSTSIVPYTHFIPMPNAPRNISISLGHYNVSNDSHIQSFFSPGEYWRDLNLGLWKYQLGVAKYMGGNTTFRLFQRKKPSLFSWGSIDHELHVNKMREVDNASGSYISGLGNIVNVADHIYFPLAAIFQAPRNSTHKSTITALGINENLWPGNGSMTMDLKSMGLMYKGYDNFGELLLSDYIGYPNLGRPNDHFEVTPFEAIFCGPSIQRHIRLNEAAPFYIDSLKQFILNEVEPWYLDLQNMRIGAQARSDYRYYSFRRAKHRIIVGEDVTPTTDKGAYIVEPNGKLALHAGDAIILKPGVHFKAGSIVHIKPAYDICGNTKMVTNDGKNNESNQNIEKTYFDRSEIVSNETEFQDFIIYPNPADNTVSIKSNDGSIAENITFYNLQGNAVLKNKSNQSLITVDIGNLNAGVYIIRISSNGKMFNKKLLVK